MQFNVVWLVLMTAVTAADISVVESTAFSWNSSETLKLVALVVFKILPSPMLACNDIQRTNE